MKNNNTPFLKFKIFVSFLFFLLLCNVNNKIFAQGEITINKVDGLFKIPCKINGVTMDFIFDTGATDVSISITEAMFLIKQGLLKSTDIIGENKYMIANGTIESGSVINLKKIEIDGITLENVKATVVNNMKAPLLLGMNAISRMGKVELSENKLTINRQENVPSEITKDAEFELFYKKATNGIYQVFKVLLKPTKVDNYITSNISLFKAPESGDELASQFDQANKDSITIAKDIKDFIFYFNKNTKSKKIDWNILTLNDFKFSIDGSDILTTIKWDSKFYVFKTWFYKSYDDNRYVISIKPILQTLAAYNYNKDLHDIFDQYDKKKITELDYITQQAAYAERSYPYLKETDLVDVRLGNRLDEIYNSAAYVYYKKTNNYQKAIEYCNKVFQIKNSRFIDDTYVLRAKCKYQLKDYQGSIDDYNEYILLDPKLDFKYVYSFRGDAKNKLGDIKNALADYLKSLKINPDNEQDYYKIGLIQYNELKNKQQACSSWSKAGELGSKEAYILIEKYCN